MTRTNGLIVRKRLHRYLPLIAIVAMLVAAAPALAGGKKAGSIHLAESNPYSVGQSVTFDTTTANVTQPWVTARCYQDGEIVYAESHAPGGTFTVGPTSRWQGGDADCTATLWYQHRQKQRVLDTIDFLVRA